MNQVTVIGAGAMGSGIAHLFAQHNFHVNLVDVSEEQLNIALSNIERNLNRQVQKELITSTEANTALNSIQSSTNLEVAVSEAYLIIEAATESIDLKKKILANVNESCKKDAIIATNTSSISISELSSVISQSENFIGMHFFNPVPVMELVEIINGRKTSMETTKFIVELSTKLGKTPIVVNDDPGFISNKVLMPMINEAIDSLYRGTSGVREIDTIMQLGMAHPMGPLKLADFIGLDVCLNILRVMESGFNSNRYSPSPLLVELVSNNELGVKTKSGFYNWNTDPKNPEVAKRFQ